MKRLYFLTPNIKSTSSIVSELKQENITEREIHIVGKDHKKLREAHLHEANLLQTTDVIPALERGALAGFLLGLFLGTIMYYYPPYGFELSVGFVIAISIFATTFGAWVSSMIGISIPDPIVDKFHECIDRGELLIIVDIPRVREDEICNMIKRHHPEAEIEGHFLNA